MSKPEDLDRWISAKWDSPTGESKSEFEAALQITAISNVRLLADITNALADMHVSLLSISTRSRDAYVTINITVACKNLEHLKSIISRLSSINSVESVVRSYI